MERTAAKELLHIQGWLERVDEIVRRARRPIARMLSFKKLATR